VVMDNYFAYDSTLVRCRKEGMDRFGAARPMMRWPPAEITAVDDD